jgi:NADP-dependent 3-hydroxy acid dehydrogenase YdfG
MDITNAVVFVTGASSGIGAATARAAAGAGAKVVLVARRSDRIAELAADLPDALAITADVTVESELLSAIQQAVETYGRIDVLVNNAGRGLHTPLAEVKTDDFRSIIELNVVTPLIAMQAVLPIMSENGGGSIINVSSGTSLMTLPGAGAYAATKSALNMLTSVARIEFAPAGVVVSNIYPFVTATEFHSSLAAGAGPQQAHSGGPVPQTAEEVADAILGLIASGDEKTILVPEEFTNR